MPRRPRGPSFHDLDPVSAFRQLVPMLEQKVHNLIEICSTEEGRRRLASQLEERGGAPQEEMSKKQQWVLRAMQQDPKFEDHLYQYARFFMQNQPGAKRIVVHGINDKEAEAPEAATGKKAK